MCLAAEVVVLAVDVATGSARVHDGRAERTVSIALRPATRVGDRVLVHTGFVVDVAESRAEPTAAG
jgi:hydrogenase maturation factor